LNSRFKARVAGDPMNYLFTKDFNEELYQVLKEYSGRRLSLMISGGSLLKCLDDQRYETMDTSNWEIFYSDERVDQDALNYTASLPFINRIKAKVHRMFSEIPEKAAREYSGVLKDVDVCLLGIGDDGHICSLQPRCRELDSDEYVVALEGSFEISPRRMTVTLKFINEKVSRLYFVIPNSNKKKITKPDESITSRIKKEFTVILEDQ